MEGPVGTLLSYHPGFPGEQVEVCVVHTILGGSGPPPHCQWWDLAWMLPGGSQVDQTYALGPEEAGASLGALTQLSWFLEWCHQGEGARMGLLSSAILLLPLQ